MSDSDDGSNRPLNARAFFDDLRKYIDRNGSNTLKAQTLEEFYQATPLTSIKIVEELMTSCGISIEEVQELFENPFQLCKHLITEPLNKADEKNGVHKRLKQIFTQLIPAMFTSAQKEQKYSIVFNESLDAVDGKSYKCCRIADFTVMETDQNTEDFVKFLLSIVPIEAKLTMFDETACCQALSYLMERLTHQFELARDHTVTRFGIAAGTDGEYLQLRKCTVINTKVTLTRDDLEEETCALWPSEGVPNTLSDVPALVWLLCLLVVPPEKLGQVRVPNCVLPGYEGVGVLGVGGFATVIAAKSPSGEAVALKVPKLTHGKKEKAAFKKLMDNEVRVLQQIEQSSPNTVRDLFIPGILLVDNEQLCTMFSAVGVPMNVFIMQFGTDKSSRSLIVEDIRTGAGYALESVHAAGFTHRDMRPENIVMMLRANGKWQPMVIDWALAGSSDELFNPCLHNPIFYADELCTAIRENKTQVEYTGKYDLESLEMVCFTILHCSEHGFRPYWHRLVISKEYFIACRKHLLTINKCLSPKEVQDEVDEVRLLLEAERPKLK